MTELLTPGEAAVRLRISVRTLRSLKAAGAIAYVAVSPRRILYRSSDLDAYIERNVMQSEPPVDMRRRGRVSVRRTHPFDIIPFSQRNKEK